MIINRSSGFKGLGALPASVASDFSAVDLVRTGVYTAINRYPEAAKRINATASLARLSEGYEALRRQSYSASKSDADFFSGKISDYRQSFNTLQFSIFKENELVIAEAKAAAAKSEADKKAADEAARKAEIASRRAAEEARKAAEEAQAESERKAAEAEEKTKKIMMAAGLVVALTLGVAGYNYFKRR